MIQIMMGRNLESPPPPKLYLARLTLGELCGQSAGRYFQTLGFAGRDSAIYWDFTQPALQVVAVIEGKATERSPSIARLQAKQV